MENKFGEEITLDKEEYEALIDELCKIAKEELQHVGNDSMNLDFAVVMDTLRERRFNRNEMELNFSEDEVDSVAGTVWERLEKSAK